VLCRLNYLSPFLWAGFNIVESRIAQRPCAAAFAAAEQMCPGNLSLAAEVYDNAVMYLDTTKQSLANSPDLQYAGLLGEHYQLSQLYFPLIAYNKRVMDGGPYALAHNIVHELLHNIAGPGHYWTEHATVSCGLGDHSWTYEEN
jgi:hypothetical protein